MTKAEVWMRPDVMLGNPEMIRCVENHVPYTVQIETTGKCAGSCIYCYSSSTGTSSGSTIPTERIYRLIHEIQEIGAPGVIWHGGDPVLHPDIWELIRYNTDLGQKNVAILPNPMSITPKGCMVIGSLPRHIPRIMRSLLRLSLPGPPLPGRPHRLRPQRLA